MLTKNIETNSNEFTYEVTKNEIGKKISFRHNN